MADAEYMASEEEDEEDYEIKKEESTVEEDEAEEGEISEDSEAELEGKYYDFHEYLRLHNIDFKTLIRGIDADLDQVIR
jgi:hypothetical protein